ncbi:hypothetical protein EC950183_4992, partial [Escherichia coli 95.0183]
MGTENDNISLIN